MKITVTIDRDEDGVWIAECPSIPGCVSQGDTKGEALVNIRKAIKLCLEVRPEAVTSRVRQLQGISDRQQLLLEACLRIGYDWTTGEIVTTRRELARELPRWSPTTIKDVFKELTRAGIMETIQQGRRDGTPSRRRLILPEGPDTSPITEKGMPLTTETRHVEVVL